MPADLHSKTIATSPEETAKQAVNLAEAKKVCLLSSVRKATEHRMLYKEGGSLRRAGYEVTIVASHPRDQVISGVAIKALPEFHSRFSRMVRKTWSLYHEALRQRADVYHFHDPELIPVGLLLKLSGKRVLYDVREDVPADLRDKHYLPRWARPVVATAADLAEKVAGRALDGIVAATPHISQRFPKRKTAIVQNFPLLDEDLPAGRPYRNREPLAAYVGSITPVRGVAELVDAMGLLPEDVPARLVIAGDFSPPSLLEMVSAKPGWARVEYLGWQQRAGLLEALQRARIGILSFLPAANHTDCQPIKLFEYMLAGLPIVAFHLPRIAEIIEQAQCGLLVEPGNSRELAAAIQWLLQNPEQAEAMGARGRKAVIETYNWNTQADLLLQLYRSIIS